jgi:hypothetical protein
VRFDSVRTPHRPLPPGACHAPPVTGEDCGKPPDLICLIWMMIKFSTEALMPIGSRYLFVASMDVDPAKEDVFNEVYDTEHIPNLMKVPGVRAVARLQGEPFAISLGGEEKKVAHDGPRYSAIYEIDSPEVLVSPAWAKAVEAGRWPSEVRPYTRNRRHALYKLR